MKKIKNLTDRRGKRFTAGDQASEGTDDCHPAFSFEHMITTHSVERCEKEEIVSLSMALYKLSQLTWKQIKSAHRHGMGFEKLPTTCIKASIPNIVTPDVNLLAFRFHGKKPMVGFRSGQVFYIIWLDRDYSLYEH